MNEQEILEGKQAYKNMLHLHPNAFIVRKHNARIEARFTDKQDWFITFTRVSKNDWKKKEKKKFDVVVERFGLIRTTKYLRLSDEAFDFLLRGYFEFKTQNPKPRPND